MQSMGLLLSLLGGTVTAFGVAGLAKSNRARAPLKQKAADFRIIFGGLLLIIVGLSLR